MKVIFSMFFIVVLLYSNNDLRLNGNGRLVIQGNGEQCKIYINRDSQKLRTTCLHLYNSKHIEIFCTRTKKICKTIDEVNNMYSGAQISNIQSDIYNMPTTKTYSPVSEKKEKSHTFIFPKNKKNDINVNKHISNTKIIVVTGYGINKEKALKNAFKTAVQQYVGVLVDTDTVMKNNKIIKDEILTASNGYIQSYDEISTSESDGFVEVQIKALVKSQKIFKKVESLNIATKKIVGAKDIHARVVTKKTFREDGEKMFKKHITNFMSATNIIDMLEVVITDVKIIEDKSKGNKVPVKITYKLKFNLDNYAIKVEKLENIFKNLGGIVHKKHNLCSYNDRGRLIWSKKEKDRIKPSTNMGFLKIYGDGYSLDMWELPSYAKVSSSDGYIDGRIKWGEIFNLLLEIKGQNGVVLKAAYIKNPRRSRFFVMNTADMGSRYDFGVPDSGNLYVISPLFAKSRGKSNAEGEHTLWLDINDIDKMSSVVMEIEKK